MDSVAIVIRTPLRVFMPENHASNLVLLKIMNTDETSCCLYFREIISATIFYCRATFTLNLTPLLFKICERFRGQGQENTVNLETCLDIPTSFTLNYIDHVYLLN